MFKNKYSNILTIILVILIIAIISIISIIGIKIYKDNKEKKERTAAMEEFDATVEVNEQDKSTGDTDLELNQEIQSGNTENNGIKKLTYYNGFIQIGKIEISKINLSYPILAEATAKALETSVAVLYPKNAMLNTKGNVVIQGHNYRNGKFFSNLSKLSIGDKIKITDTTGTTLTYTIYEIFETTPEDASYITRDTGDNIEISLSTCTDDSKMRLIILARVD